MGITSVAKVNGEIKVDRKRLPQMALRCSRYTDLFFSARFTVIPMGINRSNIMKNVNKYRFNMYQSKNLHLLSETIIHLFDHHCFPRPKISCYYVFF